MTTPPDRYQIPSLAKACTCLRLMAERTSPINPSDLARAAKMSRTTAFRLLRTLRSEGFVEEVDGGYRLGAGMLGLGIRILDRFSIRAQAVPALRELAHQVGETAHLAVLVENQALIVEVCDSPNPLRVASRPGSLVEPHCASTGKVLLAALSPAQLEALLPTLRLTKYRPTTIAQADSLRKHLVQVATQGFGVDDEEFHPGIRCVAAPVRDRTGAVVAAIGITGAATRIQLTPDSATVRQVLAVAAHLSTTLGAS
jgi:DNA-binding IclR family transcriptional regulator